MKGVLYHKHKRRFYAALRANKTLYSGPYRLSELEARRDYDELVVKYAAEIEAGKRGRTGAPKKTKTCPMCGEKCIGIDQFQPNRKQCVKCTSRLNDRRKKGGYEKTCKTCGIEFTTKDKRAVACSRKCGRSGASKQRIVRTCENCGKEIARTSFKGKWAACSTECQLVVQARKNSEKRDTTVARRKWYYKQSLRRRMANHWWRQCVKNASKLTGKRQDDAWFRRCASAASLLNRDCTITELRRKEYTRWEQAITKALTERHAKPQSKWSKKCSSIVANLKRRKVRRTQSS